MPNQMTPQDASRIQSTQAKGGGDMTSDGFASRAQAAGANNANKESGQGTNTTNTQTGNNGGQGQSGKK